MEFDDLIAHRKADAAAPGLGGAFVKLLLDEGQFRFRDTGAKVPDPNCLLPRFPADGGHNSPSRAAVLGGIVQHVAENLLQPFRVPGDRREIPLPHGVFQGDAFLTEQFLIGENGVLQLRLEIYLLHPQGEASILHFGKFQQFLHHVGEAAGLIDDNPQAPPQLHRIPTEILQNCLPPAVDSRQGCPQFVGNRGDEFRLHLLILPDFQGHIVDVVYQDAQFVGVFVFHLKPVASGRDALSGLGHHRHRLHHIVDKNQVGDYHHPHTKRGHKAHRQHCQPHLPADQPQGRDKADDSLYLSIEGQGVGHCQDAFPRFRIPALEGGHPVLGNGLGDIVGAGEGACREAGGGGDLDPSAGADKLQFDPFFVLKGRGGLLRFFIVSGPAAVHEILLKGPCQGLGLFFHAVPHTTVVIIGNPCREEDDNQQQHGKHRHHRVHNPPLPQALQPQAFPFYRFFLCHGFFSPIPAPLKGPTCSHSPTLS